MRRIILGILCICSLRSVAQHKIAVQEIGWRGNAIEIHTISDKLKQQVCSVIMNNDSIKLFIVNENLEWKHPINLRRRPEEKLYGGFFRNKKLYIFLDNGGEPGLHNYVIDLATKQVDEHMVPFVTIKEKIIDRISCGDHFLYFTVDKKTSEFIIHDFTSESLYTTTKHEFSSSMWKELTVQSGLLRSLNVEKIDLEGDCSIDVAASPNKIYVQNDTLFLLVNNIKSISKLFIFSLADQKVTVKTISHGLRTTNNIGLDVFMSDNSYFLNNKLYYVYATMDSLGIQVMDPLSGQLLNSFFVKKDQNIEFKNTPIIQEGGGMLYSLSNDRQLDKTRQLLRKMVHSNAVIMATLNNNHQVELSVGSYQVQNRSSSPGFYMSMGGGIPGSGMPGAMMFPTGGFSKSSWTKSARFKMLLDANTSEHIKGEMNITINEKIEAYTKDIKIPSEAENLFVCNGKYYYAFYDRKERTFSVVAF